MSFIFLLYLVIAAIIFSAGVLLAAGDTVSTNHKSRVGSSQVGNLDATKARAEAERDAAREALAQVEALPDEWWCGDETCDGDCGPCWYATRLRAALQPATDEGAGA